MRMNEDLVIKIYELKVFIAQADYRTLQNAQQNGIMLTKSTLY